MIRRLWHIIYHWIVDCIECGGSGEVGAVGTSYYAMCWRCNGTGRRLP